MPNGTFDPQGQEVTETLPSDHRHDEKRIAIFLLTISKIGCTAEEFQGSSINGAFTVELGDYIADSGISYWIYGHSHRNINAQIGDTRILSNQLGYTSQREHLSNGFNPSAMIEVNC